MIYQVHKKFWTTKTIQIRYDAQQNFDRKSKHPFDAEALLHYKGRLLLFSKNRADQTTQLYWVDKTKPKQVLKPLATWAVGSLITGADYDPKSNTLALTGYGFDGVQYLYVVSEWDADQPQKAAIQKFVIPVGESTNRGGQNWHASIVLGDHRDGRNQWPQTDAPHLRSSIDLCSSG